MQDHSLGSQVTHLGDPDPHPGQELGPADERLVVFAEAWGPVNQKIGALILHHTHQHLGGQDGGSGDGADTDRQVDRNRWTKSQRDEQLQTQNHRGREYEIWEGIERRRKYTHISFPLCPTGHPGIKPSGK